MKIKFTVTNDANDVNDTNYVNDVNDEKIELFIQKRNFSFYLTMKIQFTDTKDDNDALSMKWIEVGILKDCAVSCNPTPY